MQKLKGVRAGVRVGSERPNRELVLQYSTMLSREGGKCHVYRGKSLKFRFV